MDLSIVIVNWNTGGLLRDCVASALEHSDGLDLEVIVIDNASTDDSMQLLPRDARCTSVLNDENQGFAAANNQGFRMASGRYLLMLNPDTVVLPGALARMVGFMDAHPAAGAAGPRLLNADRTLQHSCSRLPDLRSLVIETFALERILPGRRAFEGTLMTHWDHDTEREVPQPSGAALLLRRAAAEPLGYLDERFYVYLEEVDLCRRLLEAGWQIHFVPDATIIHFGGQSSLNNPDVRIVTRYRSLLLYYQKHFGPGTVVAARVLVATQMLLRVTTLPLLAGRLSWRGSTTFSMGDAARRYMRVLALALKPLRAARDGAATRAALPTSTHN